MLIKARDNIHIIRNIMDYIEENIKEPLTLDMLSAHFNYSKSHLNRIFRNYTTKTVMKYVKERKLMCSINELKYTDYSITRIADEYNFEYVQSYVRSFKDLFKISPSKLRNVRISIKVTEKIEYPGFIDKSDVPKYVNEYFR